MSGLTSRYPFTAAQWQELEHQALFFKLMVSGLPIPPDLLFNIKGRANQPHHIGWTCFQPGLSQNRIDPEPTRCRRTDGKKWRCSRPTSGEAKYCERHMHRGKSRTRKLPDSKPLQAFPFKSSSSSMAIPSTSVGAGTQSNSNLSSVTCEMTHKQQHLFNFNTNSSSKPVKDSTFTTFLGIKSPEKRESVVMHQFIEESPQVQLHGRRDSWLGLAI